MDEDQTAWINFNLRSEAKTRRLLAALLMAKHFSLLAVGCRCQLCVQREQRLPISEGRRKQL